MQYSPKHICSDPKNTKTDVNPKDCQSQYPPKRKKGLYLYCLYVCKFPLKLNNKLYNILALVGLVHKHINIILSFLR